MNNIILNDNEKEEEKELLIKLKKELDNLPLFKELDLYRQNISNNKELVEKIEKYNLTKNNNLRLDIYSYKEIQEYKEKENELNLMILEINKKLKTITNKRSCHNESN